MSRCVLRLIEREVNDVHIVRSSTDKQETGEVGGHHDLRIRQDDERLTEPRCHPGLKEGVQRGRFTS
jgi:hypothetical protein